VAIDIAIEDPLSGMSMNPARTLGPALLSGATEHLWVYFTAPVLGMGLAAELYSRLPAAAGGGCAKLHHPVHGPCIFRCGDAVPSVGPKEAAAA
jgi:aquaporin Z